MALEADLQLAERGLDALEEQEVRALVWGLVDGAMATDEVDETLRSVVQDPANAPIRQRIECTIVTALDLRNRLISLRMLFPALDASGREIGWRTRMAEGVRLIAQLRQLFPRHAGDAWTEAPTLVADYRFLRRPRRYPKRNIPPTDAEARIAEIVSEPVLLSAVSQWLDGLRPDGHLARFQIDSAVRILASLQSGTTTGTLVSAGTGSGKTIAFYLPALAWLASQRTSHAAGEGVRVLALYPRNELLKDQLAEVFGQCRRFDGWIAAQGKRPLRVGVLYGETPQVMKDLSKLRGWPRSGRGAICPFFRCPECDSDMEVRREDLESKRQRLVCTRCDHTVGQDQLAYTREVIAQDPPDILFTSVEMLNRHLPTVEIRHVFGVGPKASRAPDLVLLDEVHLYAGTYGAQVAFLMRRWWAASGRRSSFVGLSATIADGRNFFASLTGLNENAVQEIKPLDDDLEYEGAEYLLALRGDPVSQSALLSATIQTLMLGARLLDSRERFDKNQHPFFGWRAFAFTDQLDAANRLFRDLQDAEGRYPNGQVNTQDHPSGGLARLRASDGAPAPGRRYLRGQDWRVPEEIGHALTDRLEVTRTTSYDSGVSTLSQVVVATAALEVGFDDPAVGLVVQHKAPRDMASFLQRKGRAGRTRHTRPWTVVVLSDYGRDRMAYQAYEELFDPELPPRALPLSNRYVQRMQAVFALLDELGERLQAHHPQVNVWQEMRGPNVLPDWPDNARRKLAEMVSNGSPQSPAEVSSWRGRAFHLAPPNATNRWAGANWVLSRVNKARLLELLRHYLESKERADQVGRKLGQRLALSAEEMIPLLWQQPRPLMLGAIPTAVRRLSTNWRADGKPEGDYQAGHPLPEYVPANLFDDLSLPEMHLEFPSNASSRLDTEFMPVLQGLGEFAPGKVSRRYNDPLWLGFDGAVLAQLLDEQAGSVVDREVDIDAWWELEAENTFHETCQEGVAVHLAFRPRSAHLVRCDQNRRPQVSDTSNAQLVWSSHLHAPSGGDIFHPPEHVGIARLVGHISVHTHARQNAALVRRYAIGSRNELRLRSGTTNHRITVNWKFRHASQPAGVGYQIETDALVLTLKLPVDLHQEIEWTSERVRAARSARFNFEVQRNPAFADVVPNSFLRGWIAQIFLIAGILRAEQSGQDLAQSLDALTDPANVQLLLDVFPAVFQAAEEGGDSADRLRQSLDEQLRDLAVLQAVRQVARVLVESIDAEWNNWLSLVMRTTLGAACLEAIQHACPQVDVEALVVDIGSGCRNDGHSSEAPQIWISEVNPGGNGLIEQVVELLSSHPETLYRHVEVALGAQDFEFSSTQLRQVAGWLGGNEPDERLAESFRQVREATRASDAQRLFGGLRAELTRRGQSMFHGYAVALGMRLLRPQTPTELDRMIDQVYTHWESVEARLMIEIDVRVMCAVHSVSDRLDRVFGNLGFPLPSENRAHWRFSVLLGMLWARGHALRAVALPLSNRFTAFPVATERLLLAQWLTDRPPAVDPSVQSNWLDVAREQLRTRQTTTIGMECAQARHWAPLVTQALVLEPIQFDYLNIYARLAEVKRLGSRIEWTFNIREST
jgi:hypothetical protein